MYLAPFDFVIKHRSGITNPADAPSRRPDYEGDAGPQTELLTPLQQKLVTVEALAQCLRPRMARLPGEPLGATAQRARCKCAFPSRAFAAAACIQEAVEAEESAGDLWTLFERLQNEDPETQV